MAKIIKNYVPVLQKNSRYPWKEWTDGQARELKRGVDFSCRCEAIRSAVQYRSGIIGRQGHVHIIDDETVIVVFDPANDKKKK